MDFEGCKSANATADRADTLDMDVDWMEAVAKHFELTLQWLEQA